MKKFDLSKTYVIYSQIGDTIYARLATAEDLRKNGTRESSDGQKRGGVIPLFTLCLLQMELLPRERQLLDYPIFQEDDDLEIRALYAAAVWTIAIHRAFHGVGYPKDAMYRAEKAARLGDGWLDLQASQWPPMSI